MGGAEAMPEWASAADKTKSGGASSFYGGADYVNEDAAWVGSGGDDASKSEEAGLADAAGRRDVGGAEGFA